MCPLKSQTFDRVYSGYWYESSFRIHFKKDGKFEIRSRGHGEVGTIIGQYTIEKDTFINLITNSKSHLDRISNRFRILNDSIILDCVHYWDYLLDSHWFATHTSRKRYEYLVKANLEEKFEIKRKAFKKLIIKCNQYLISLADSAEKGEWYRYDESEDFEVVQLLRAYNTLLDTKDSALQSGIYKEFMHLIRRKDHITNILEFYRCCIAREPSGGYYILYMDIELGGIIHTRSKYSFRD